MQLFLLQFHIPQGVLFCFRFGNYRPRKPRQLILNHIVHNGKDQSMRSDDMIKNKLPGS
jgi:hypothetical protein